MQWWNSFVKWLSAPTWKVGAEDVDILQEEDARSDVVAALLQKQDQMRLSSLKDDRWARMLKALQIVDSALMPAIQREIAKGMDEPERLLEPEKMGKFFDGLMVRKKVEALDVFCGVLDPDAVTDRIMGKLPSLRDWAIGVVTGEELTRESNPEMVAWAREKGHFADGVLRESLLAEAIEGGRTEVARRELSDAGLEKLDSAQMAEFMQAFAKRKEAGLSEGLDAMAMEAFADCLGGWDVAAESLAGLGPEEIMALIEDLLSAVKDEALLEEKVFAQAKTKSGKKAREMFAMAIAAQSAKKDMPISLAAAIKEAAAASGKSVDSIASSPIETARVKVGGMDVKTTIAGGVNLSEIAALSKAGASSKVLATLTGRSEPITPARMEALVANVEKNVRQMVMRGNDSQKASTKAWRETVKEWKQGLLGDASVSDIKKIAQEKMKAAEPKAKAPKM